jgi:hypothetical protein
MRMMVRTRADKRLFIVHRRGRGNRARDKRPEEPTNIRPTAGTVERWDGTDQTAI